MSTRPAESRYLSSNAPPFELSAFSTPDLEAYIARLGLDKGIIDQPPSLDLLSTLLTQHQLTVPFDVSSLHVQPDDWTAQSKPIELGRGKGMQLGQGNFDRVVNQGRGGECPGT